MASVVWSHERESLVVLQLWRTVSGSKVRCRLMRLYRKQKETCRDGMLPAFRARWNDCTMRLAKLCISLGGLEHY